MKIQCSCGAKYELDLLPEMATQPIKFVCPACGLDSSEFVNGLIRQELGQSAPAAAPAGVLLEPAPAAPQPPPQEPAPLRPGPALAREGPICSKHPGQIAAEKCRVCSKPICPKCMELFGYACSPLCKARASSMGIHLPTYDRQSSVVEARLWRKVVHVSLAAGATIVALVAVWIWYAWFGSLPKPTFSARFPAPAYSGQSMVAGKKNDQIIFLHGGTLARYDMQTKQMIWSRELIDHKEIEIEAAAEMKAWEAEKARMLQDNPDAYQSMRYGPSQEKLTQSLERARAAGLALHVRGGNVWVAEEGKIVQYDWDTGNPLKNLPFERGFGSVIARQDELLVCDTGSGRPVVTHVNLASCESRTEDLGGPPPTNAAPPPRRPGGRGTEMAGLPLGRPGKDAGKPMDPAKVAEQVQHLPMPARIALPALLSVNANQERALAEMQDNGGQASGGSGSRRLPDEQLFWVPTQEGFVQVGVRLLESRMVEHEAMKAAPAKSVLDGNLTAGNTLEAANEILNDMQRSRGGNKVTEDQSRYQVSLHQPDGTEQWHGEVVGPPTFFPLQTINVVTANKSIVVLDKSNKKLWESALSYNVMGDMGALEPDESPYGQGPLVEHKGGLYVFDQGVLTAFDLANGTVRWRLPSVGTTGIFFDDHDQIYVNTTTASLDSIKYSRQIDVSQKVGSIVFKIDSRTGKVAWKASPGGLVNYVSGKYVYTVSYYQPPDEEDSMLPSTGFEAQAYMRLRRINPSTGMEMWEHFEQRAPLDVRFDKNSIRLVFKKEVEVLKFLSL